MKLAFIAQRSPCWGAGLMRMRPDPLREQRARSDRAHAGQANMWLGCDLRLGAVVFLLSWGNCSCISFAIIKAASRRSLPTIAAHLPDLVEHAVRQAASLMLDLDPPIGVLAHHRSLARQGTADRARL